MPDAELQVDQTLTDTGRITLSPIAAVIHVQCGGDAIARSEHALELRETGYPPVIYVPIADVQPGVLGHNPATSHCPFKGDARYYDVTVGDQALPNAAWHYPDPRPELAAIADCVAFYPDPIVIWRE